MACEGREGRLSPLGPFRVRSATRSSGAGPVEPIMWLSTPRSNGATATSRRVSTLFGSPGAHLAVLRSTCRFAAVTTLLPPLETKDLPRSLFRRACAQNEHGRWREPGAWRSHRRPTARSMTAYSCGTSFEYRAGPWWCVADCWTKVSAASPRWRGGRASCGRRAP